MGSGVTLASNHRNKKLKVFFAVILNQVQNPRRNERTWIPGELIFNDRREYKNGNTPVVHSPGWRVILKFQIFITEYKQGFFILRTVRMRQTKLASCKTLSELPGKDQINFRCQKSRHQHTEDKHYPNKPRGQSFNSCDVSNKLFHVFWPLKKTTHSYNPQEKQGFFILRTLLKGRQRSPGNWGGKQKSASREQINDR